MLVLTRRIGEEIVIGGEIRVTVVAIKGDRVRLGVRAPNFVRVDRQEVHERRLLQDVEEPHPPGVVSV
jgi:carbon storage regulator